MLLVTFHGGTNGINNVYCYDSTTGTLLSDRALREIDSSKLSELRALIYYNGYLYVANGARTTSDVLTFQHQSTEKPYHFAYKATFIGPTLSHGGNFKTSIAHPFSLVFDGEGYAYVSNQDTNVVARVTVSSDSQTGILPSGCQSDYLIGLEKTISPGGQCVFLDGTFVASQRGALDHVDVTATDVPEQYGGLSVWPATGKVQHSVRDVAIANGMLFVCDEPSHVVRIYRLPDGTYLGAGAQLPESPTHLAVQNGGLYASAGGVLYWSPLPVSPSEPTLTFQNVLTAPTGTTIGGISFDLDTPPAIAYACIQWGTGGAVGGSIKSYSVDQKTPMSPPAFSNEAVMADGLNDTPEFVLYLTDTLT